MSILFVGAAGVGKTTMINRHMTGAFVKIYNPTFDCKTIHHAGLTMYDKSGQDILNIIPVDQVNKVVIMFDLTSRVTFRRVRFWLNKIRVKYPNLGNENIILCGNKVDIIRGRKVTDEDIENQYPELACVLTSVKTGVNINMVL